MKRSDPHIPRGCRPSTVEARALVLNAIFAKNWPAGILRPTLPQIRAVLKANEAIDRVHDQQAQQHAEETG